MGIHSFVNLPDETASAPTAESGQPEQHRIYRPEALRPGDLLQPHHYRHLHNAEPRPSTSWQGNYSHKIFSILLD